ncbi:BrxA family protein [Rubrivirga litoralis]|uniref:DUF1819 family protein n=1 Tax=Rubrivirga litoralis TaxID=3075598 RepID=A0ABU3BQ69_9BACT|nr:BrxA family protein [Rubrivirga sp. F394]MDT0631441.1 DUF1819 family protein [Rubrivirga sp. F394]
MTPTRKDVVSSFTLIKGALVDETYAAFADWDLGQTQDENLDRLRRTNSIGASSANWLRDVAKVLHRRYDPEGRDAPLVGLAQRGCPRDVWTPLMIWHATRDEFLLADFLREWLYERHRDGVYRVRVEDLLPYLASLPSRAEAVTGTKQWSESTAKRVASSLLKISNDVGLLRGTRVREFAPYRLPDPSLLYLLHAVAEREPNARNLLDAPDWRMYLMSAADVEREVLRLHQYRALDFQAAGSLAQLRLPAPSLADFARQMTW